MRWAICPALRAALGWGAAWPVREEEALGRRTRKQAKPNPGFTLIEAAMATVIIGVGVLAMVDAQQAFIRSNMWSSHAASAAFLGNEVRELMRHLPRHDPVVGLGLDDGGGLFGWGPEPGENHVVDFDDVDDFDGIVFRDFGTPGVDDGDLPGPINAFGEVIPAIDLHGTELGTSSADAEPVFTGEAMAGWSQTVIVEKVDPFNTAIVLPDGFFEAAAPGLAGRDVDSYPLRVTVEVRYQGLNDVEPTLIGEVSWIVP